MMTPFIANFFKHPFEVWQYYLLPDEEQKASGTKNPMCNTFPRIGDHVDDELLHKARQKKRQSDYVKLQDQWNGPYFFS